MSRRRGTQASARKKTLLIRYRKGSPKIRDRPEYTGSSRSSAKEYTRNNLTGDPTARCGRLTSAHREGHLEWSRIEATSRASHRARSLCNSLRHRLAIAGFRSHGLGLIPTQSSSGIPNRSDFRADSSRDRKFLKAAPAPEPRQRMLRSWRAHVRECCRWFCWFRACSKLHVEKFGESSNCLLFIASDPSPVGDI